MRRTAVTNRAAALLALAVLLAAPAACRRSGVQGGEHRAAIRSSLAACEAFEAEMASVPLRLSNEGTAAWRSDGTPPILVSYHVLDGAGAPVRFENARFPLPHAVEPGGTAALDIQVKAPLEAGIYGIEFDLVAEGKAWFKDGGSKTLVMPFEVGRREWPEDRYEISLDAGPYTKIESSVPELNALMKLIRITLKHNEVSFEGGTGRVDGFAAGAGYPQIWVRDAATIIPAAKYFYPASHLFSWLDELMSRQSADGSLPDWFDARGATDKNTVETDQEASAVQAQRLVADLMDAEWERREVRSVPVLERLDRALSFVVGNRFDVERELVTGAHTADWGDVEMEDADQAAIYAGESTRWTSDIYDQSMFYQAANDLATSLERAGFAARAGLWRRRAEALRRAADRWLWQEDRGYYRVHIHSEPWRHDLDENAMFAMGGNAQALVSGLAGPPGGERPRRIIAEALSRQKEYEISTVSGSLLPPYPAGFFRHPALDEPYEYQNGGQWDWFGGKLVLAMFGSGVAREARTKLLEIARKAVGNAGFHEWDTRDGRGRGSDFYSGSAGSLARALVEGYYGVRLKRTSLELSPRMGPDTATVHVRVPAAGRYVAYDYRVESSTRRVFLGVRSDASRADVLRILDPWLGDDGGPDAAGIEVYVDSGRVGWTRERVGADAYVRLDAVPVPCRVEVRYLRPTE